MWQFWLIASGIFFIAEILTTGFLIFWLGVASLITMIVSLFTSNLFIQSLIFVCCSAILIPITKPFLNKFVSKTVTTTKTNVFSMIGKKALVIEDINSINNSGQIKVNGEIWSADSIDHANIEKGTEVEIKKIEGVKAIVFPIEK